MQKYAVTYSYTINVEAEDKTKAEEKANQEWDEIAPRIDEMNVEVEEVLE